MKLKRLLKGVDYTLIKGSIETEICDLSYNSNDINDGYVFVSIIGNNVDGHDYINNAINNGAVAIIICSDINIDKDVTIIKVNDTNMILSRLSMNLFDNPHEKITTIAITGTKGKTTTSFMIKKIIEEAGYKCGVIGSTGVYIGDKYYISKNTTPLAYDILKYMNEMVSDNIRYVVMEVSSQALKYYRVNNIVFDYGVFTNLSHDHIGKFEHDDMDDYVSSKSKLFKQSIQGILNVDDKYYFDMIDKCNSTINTYGFCDKADLKVKTIDLYKEGNNIGIILDVDGILNSRFKISSPGKFSAYNAMGAILTCNLLGIDVEYMNKALSNFSLKGRVEPVLINSKFMLFIDYAHNGVSAENVLTTIREYNPNRIISVFGCGGNRSKDRRYEMGESVGRYSDICIVTEDNNRFEEFDNIAKDILVGINKTNCNYVVIADRKEAIKYAIENAIDGDIIMLLGKGHEDYKEIKGIKYPFDERIIIKEILNEIN